jgi:hypothetical protein
MREGNFAIVSLTSMSEATERERDPTQIPMRSIGAHKTQRRRRPLTGCNDSH